MDTPRLAVIIFLLLFLLWSPDSRAPSVSQQLHLDQAVLEERRSLEVLNTSSYGGLDVPNGRWLNLTGLRKEDQYAWHMLPKLGDRVKEQFNTVAGRSISPQSFRNISTLSNDQMFPLEDEQNYAERALSTMDPFEDPSPFYQNMTSVVDGKWARSKIGEGLAPPMLNLSALAPKVYYNSNKYDRNITGQTGDLRIFVRPQSHPEIPSDLELVRSVKSQLTIVDESSSGDGWYMDLFGVHYPKMGSMVLSTTSEKFAGIFALPHFTLSERAFMLAQKVLNHTLMETIKEQEADFTSTSNPWTSLPSSPSEVMFPVPHCELIVYLQQHPVEDASIDINELEQELRFPTGAAMPAAPKIKMSALMFSPDCGFVLESMGPPDFTPQQGLHLNGRRLEVQMQVTRRCILAFATLISAQLLLWSRQMKDTSTPSTRSRVSFYTISILALGDGLVLLGCLNLAMLREAVFLPLVATAFLAYLCVNFMGIEFMLAIWAVQAPERQERERERLRRMERWNGIARTAQPARATAPAATTSAAGTDTLPLPVTARRPADPPIIITPDQDIEAAEVEDGATIQNTAQAALGGAAFATSTFYGKFYLLAIGILCTSLFATTWPLMLRSLYTNALAFVYLSFWTTQIHRNVIRNCRKALRWEFVVGQSVLRLAPIAFFYTVPNNVLFVRNDINAAYVLAGWVWIQICALISQEILGPRFFVPNGWAPPAYDYHPILREEDEKAGSIMPIGFTQATADPTSPTATKPGESKEKGKKIFDCAICTEDIEVPVVPSAGNGDGESVTSIAASTIFSRRAYMVTPCRHIFHSQCLEGWMRYRLQCPICRENLPPL